MSFQDRHLSHSKGPHNAAWLGPLLILLAAPSLWAASPLTLTHELRVKIKLQLTLQQPPLPAKTVEETLVGRAGETLAFVRDVGERPGELVVALTVIAEPDLAAGMCHLLFDSEVHQQGKAAVQLSRDAQVGPGRLLLSDIWSEDATKRRLMLAISTSWEEIPQLQTLHPGAEPVELMLEVLAWDGSNYRSLEKNRMGSIVGKTINYVFKRRPGLAEDAPPTERLHIEMLPESIRDGAVMLKVRVRREHGGVGDDRPAAETSLSERLFPGFAIDVPLAGLAGQPGLIFRVTPYF